MVKLQWSNHDVYIRHPGGGKDSRHRDGRTHLTSTDENRLVESRIPTSEVSREIVNYVELQPCLMEPQTNYALKKVGISILFCETRPSPTCITAAVIRISVKMEMKT